MSCFVEDHFSYGTLRSNFFDKCRILADASVDNWCCLAIDIEHFKLFNAIHGRKTGDALLSAFAAALHEHATEHRADFAYLGQDDFVVFTSYDQKVIRALMDTLRNIVIIQSNTISYLPACGVYKLHPGESIDLDMYDKASSALAEAKKNLSTRIHEYDPAAYEKEQDEFRILSEVKQAMVNGEITFFLQPQCRMSTRKIVGAEALARWIRKDGSAISPGQFIPTLERKGFITDFDRVIWRLVFQWLRSLLDKGIEPIPISINVSQIDILTMNVVDYLMELSAEYAVPARYVKVEITESSYAEKFDTVKRFAESLKQQGFLVMMDDFGSGYSSLNMLAHVNVDVLKLDMAFIHTSNLQSQKGVAIVESIANSAKMMNMPIVVEGVETAEQVQFLRNLGCRYAQGYHFFKPMPTTDFEKLLHNKDKLDYRGFSCKLNKEMHVREFIDEHTFTDTMLNNILGAVAFYSLEDGDLTITRFNEQFYRAISDGSMQQRQQAIQHYVVKEDWPALYEALDQACLCLPTGGTCEVRFYKSDNSVFWFRMHFFYLRTEGKKRIFFGQVQDVTEIRQQCLEFFEVLREKADVTMMINLDKQTIQYINASDPLSQVGLPNMQLQSSIEATVQNRIDDEADRARFREFFDADRLRSVHHRGSYHEVLTTSFRMQDAVELMEFSTYYIRYSKEQDLIVYVFAKGLEE